MFNMSDWLTKKEQEVFGNATNIKAAVKQDALSKIENDKQEYEKKLNSVYNTEFGVISGKALNALETNGIETYIPVDNAENEAIIKYKNYMDNQIIPIPLSNNKQISLKNSTIKNIDDIFKEYKGKVNPMSRAKISKQLDEKI